MLQHPEEEGPDYPNMLVPREGFEDQQSNKNLQPSNLKGF